MRCSEGDDSLRGCWLGTHSRDRWEERPWTQKQVGCYQRRGREALRVRVLAQLPDQVRIHSPRPRKAGKAYV